jgi:hypothetical protein
MCVSWESHHLQVESCDTHVYNMCSLHTLLSHFPLILLGYLLVIIYIFHFLDKEICRCHNSPWSRQHWWVVMYIAVCVSGKRWMCQIHEDSVFCDIVKLSVSSLFLLFVKCRHAICCKSELVRDILFYVLRFTSHTQSSIIPLTQHPCYWTGARLSDSTHTDLSSYR